MRRIVMVAAFFLFLNWALRPSKFYIDQIGD